MRIAFLGIVSACDPMNIGGAESVTRRLASVVSSKCHEVIIVLYGVSTYYETRADFDETIKITYCESFSSALDKLSESRPDIVIEIQVNKQDIIQYINYKRKKKKSVRFIKIFLIYPAGKTRRLLHNLLRVAYCHSVFAISPRLVKDLKQYGINAIWLPPPVPEHYFDFERRNSGDKIRISYIGRIAEDKGCNEILSTFGLLEDLNDIELSIHGYYDPTNQNSVTLHKAFQRLRKIKYDSISRQFSRYSNVSESLFLKYLRETDILVVPYRNLHGTVDVPLLLVEGLATKCAVLTTNVGDNAFLIENNDFVIERSEDLTAKLRHVIKPEILKKEILRISSRDFHATYADYRVADVLLEHISLGHFEN